MGPEPSAAPQYEQPRLAHYTTALHRPVRRGCGPAGRGQRRHTSQAPAEATTLRAQRHQPVEDSTGPGLTGQDPNEHAEDAILKGQRCRAGQVHRRRIDLPATDQ